MTIPAVRFAVHIGTDIVRVIRQDDYDVSAAIERAFQEVRDDGVHVHMPSGRLTVVVERVR